MTTYKLIYFNYRALGESLRWIFLLAGKEFEDVRIERENWGSAKNDVSSIYGQLPVLHIKLENGETRQLAQATAIGRYLAKEFNVSGKTDKDDIHCDEVVDAVMDLRSFWQPFYYETDPAKKEEIKKDLLTPSKLNVFLRYLQKLDEFVLQRGESKFVVCNEPTWADLFLANWIEIFQDTLGKNILNDYPYLQRQKEAVLSLPQIKSWISKRPKFHV